MEPCHEYLGCDRRDCVVYGQEEDGRRCWEVEGSLSNYEGIQLVRNMLEGKKEHACIQAGCLYYKAAEEAAP